MSLFLRHLSHRGRLLFLAFDHSENINTLALLSPNRNCNVKHQRTIFRSTKNYLKLYQGNILEKHLYSLKLIDIVVFQ